MSDTRKIQLIHVAELDYSLKENLIPETKEKCETDINPGFGFKIKINEDNSTLSIEATAFYANKAGVEVADSKFIYVLYFENMDTIIKKDKDESFLYIPDEIMDVVIQEAFITGRMFLSSHVKNTALKDLYLPFNGASSLIKQVKSQNKKKKKEIKDED